MNAVAYAVLDLYAGNFAARHDGYVLDSRAHRNEPITPAVLDWAFTSGHSISGYLARVEDGAVTTTVGAIDLDEGSMEDGARVRALLKEHSIPSLVVESRRGCHIWTFHHGDGTHGSTPYQPVPAHVVRACLVNAAKLVDLDGPKVEVFPRASVSPWGVGALRMPLMPHPKAGGHRFPAYDMDGAKVEKVVDLINAIADMTAPYQRVHALSGVDAAEVPYPSDLGDYRRQPRDLSDAPDVVELLARVGVLAEGKRAVRCPWHDDSHASLSIAPDRERVWCKSPACPVHNGGRGMGSLALRAMIEKGDRR